MERHALPDVTQAQQLVRQAGLDAIIATAPENVTRLSGSYRPDQFVLPSQPHAYLMPSQGSPVILEAREDQIWARQSDDMQSARLLDSGPGKRLRTLGETMRERGLVNGRIGIDLSRCSVAMLRGLERGVNSAVLTDVSELLERFRMLKLPQEVAVLRLGATATAKSIAIAFARARPGDTAKSMADVAAYYLLKLGAEALGINRVIAGHRATSAGSCSSEEAVRPGDLLCAKSGGVFRNYFSCLGRMAVVGRPTDRQRAMYTRCYAVHRRCLDLVRAGVTGEELHRSVSRVYAESGLPMTRMSFGHGIGLSLLERPVLTGAEPWTLEPDTVLYVENGWSDLDRLERYELGDMVRVTATSCELLAGYGDSAELQVID